MLSGRAEAYARDIDLMLAELGDLPREKTGDAFTEDLDGLVPAVLRVSVHPPRLVA